MTGALKGSYEGAEIWPPRSAPTLALTLAFCALEDNTESREPAPRSVSSTSAEAAGLGSSHFYLLRRVATDKLPNLLCLHVLTCMGTVIVPTL